MYLTSVTIIICKSLIQRKRKNHGEDIEEFTKFIFLKLKKKKRKKMNPNSQFSKAAVQSKRGLRFPVEVVEGQHNSLIL